MIRRFQPHINQTNLTLLTMIHHPLAFSVQTRRSSHSSSSSSTTTTTNLTHDQVVSFRDKGYLVLENFFSPQVLQQYYDSVKRAVDRRGPKLVFPNPDGNAYDLEVNVQGQSSNIPGASNQQRQQQQNRNSGGGGGGNNQQQQVQKQHIQIQASSKRKCIRMAQKLRKKLKETQQNEGGMRVFDDETKMTTEELQDAHDEYIRSDQFQKEVVRKMRVQELTRFFETIHKPWIHLWHGDEELSHFLLNETFKNCKNDERASSLKNSKQQQQNPTTVGYEIGKVASEATGSARIRLFSDRAAYRCAWGNAAALQCTQPFVDFNDYRGACVTTIFPPVGLNRENGGYVVLEKSHHVMRKLTMNLADASVYKACPTAWDFGDVCRRHPTEFRQCPAKELSLKPGDVLIYSNQLVFGQVPNYSTEENFSHAVYTMPDGCVFNGLKHTWLSHDKEGPLNEYRSGDPLNDDALFPILYSAIDDLF